MKGFIRVVFVGVLFAAAFRVMASRPILSPLPVGPILDWYLEIDQNTRREQAHLQEVLITSARIVSAFDRKGNVLSHVRNERVRIYLQGSKSVSALFRKDRIYVRAKLSKPRGFHNPGRRIRRSRLLGNLYLRKQPIEVITSSTRWRRKWVRFHWQIQDEMDRILTSQQAGYIKTLLLGKRNALSPHAREIFLKTGVAHVFAISGLHVGIFIAFIGYLTFQTLRRSRFLNCRINPHLLSFGILVPLLIAYVLFTGSSPSVIRAAWMAGLFLLSRFLKRGYDGLVIWAWIAAGSLIIEPDYFWSLSWQLSFSAVFMILLGMKKVPLIWPLSSRSQGHFLPLQRYFLAMVWLNFWAFLGTFPLIWYHFQFFSLVGFLTNLWVVPWVTFIVLPLLFLSLPLYAIFPWGSKYLWFISSEVLIFLEQTLKPLSFLPWVSIYGASWVPYILYFLFLVIIFVPLRTRKTFAFVWVGMLSIFVGMTWFHREQASKRFWIEFLDVGHGDAICIHFPGNHYWFMDGGGFAYGGMDVGRSIWLPYIRSRGISHVDRVIISHPHADHYLGFMTLLRYLPARALWHNGQIPNEFYKKWFQELKNNGVQVKHKFPKILKISTAKIEHIHPPSGYQDPDPNNHSLVFLISIFDHRILLTGDIEKEAELAMTSNVRNLPSVDILKVPHHGSKTSSSLHFLNAFRPKLAISSSRRWGRNYFPHRSVLKRYREQGIPLFSTEHCGAIRWEISPQGGVKWRGFKKGCGLH